MKVATALKTALAAFPQRERRIALAQFVTRYADTAAKLTHYRCVGLDADVITAFLAAAGFTDADYTLVRSELDPDTRQIRWKKGSKCLGRLVESLTETIREGASCPEMYRCIGNGDPSHVFKDIPDPEDTPERTSRGGGPHLSEIVQSMTDELLEWARPCSTSEKARVWCDCINRDSYRANSEAAARETRVHIPPIPALEQYAWSNNLLPDEVAKPPRPIFTTCCRDMTAVRYMDDEDSVGFTKGIYDAPASLMLAPYSDLSDRGNPLNGFLVDTAKQAFSNMQVKPDSKVAYVLTSGTVETEYAEEFKLRIVEFVADPKKLWNYVAGIYESVYRGLVCTIMPHSHVGLNNNVTSLFPEGARYMSDMGGDESEYNPFYTDDNHELLSVCAGVALARREDIACLPQSRGFHFRDKLANGYEVPIESLIRNPDSPEPEHIRIAPDKKDLPAMWFAATHLEPGAVTPARQTMIDAMAPLPGVSHQEQAESMQRFYDLTKRWDTADLSAIREEDVPQATEGPCLLAFVTGLSAAVIQSYPRDVDEALAKWQPLDGSSKGHLDSLFVTNVYSGVVTDKSPTLAESVHEGATVFPFVYDERYECDSEFARTPVGLAETAMFTKFVADISAGTSPAQMTMAPKSEGTRRSFILIAETNFDYDWFKGKWLDQPAIRQNVLNAFNQAYVYRNRCFAASISPSYRVNSFPFFSQMSASFTATTGVSWISAMTMANVVCSDSVNVTIRPDNYGRTYFVYRISVDNAMDVMAAFRFLAGMPVHTKWLARLIDASRRSDETLTPEEVSDPTTGTVHKYIRLIMRKKLAASGHDSSRLVSHEISAQDKLHVWLAAVSRCAVNDGVGEMNAPSKALLTRAVVGSECNLPIISNFGAPLS